MTIFQEMQEIMKLCEALEVKTKEWQSDLTNDFLSIRALAMKGSVEGLTECKCGKCEARLKCEHDGDKHEISICGNCAG